MAAPTNHWKLGLFVVVGLVMALSTGAVLGARSMRKEVVRYVSYFDESVQGLETGSPIKFRGVTIGNVGWIDVAPDHRHVEVTSELGVAELSRLGLDVAAGMTVRGAPKKLEMATDMRVQLASSGLTGVKFLQLDFFPVDTPAPVLPFPVPANYIPAASSTMKNLEDSLAIMMTRLPELAVQMNGILTRIDNLLGDVKDKQLPEQIVATLNHATHILATAERKLEEVDAGKLSKQADKTLGSLNITVTRMNLLLARIDGDKGLLASVSRASEAVGATAHTADGLGSQLEDTLGAVQDAAKSIHKLADALEKDPDMLLKGHAERSR